ncbi:MAG: hypothetical protein ABMA01_17340, partial [Chthoniobacteraceae bacterium]
MSIQEFLILHGRPARSAIRAVSLWARTAITRTIAFGATFTVAGTGLACAFAITRAAALCKGWTFTVAGRTRHQLVHGQFSVGVLVELAQSLGGVRDFILGDLSVAILVERGDHRR